MTPTRPPGRIEKLNGQQLYFEVHGTGEPLLNAGHARLMAALS